MFNGWVQHSSYISVDVAHLFTLQVIATIHSYVYRQMVQLMANQIKILLLIHRHSHHNNSFTQKRIGKRNTIIHPATRQVIISSREVILVNTNPYQCLHYLRHITPRYRQEYLYIPPLTIYINMNPLAYHKNPPSISAHHCPPS